MGQGAQDGRRIPRPVSGSHARSQSGEALRIDDIDKPAISATEAPAAGAPVTDPPVTPTTPEMPTPQTFVEAEAHAAAREPLAISRRFNPSPRRRTPRPRRRTRSRTPKRHERRSAHENQETARATRLRTIGEVSSAMG
jgi:hypothetical protein